MLRGDVLGERARLTPEAEALVVVRTGARFTFAELDARASRCACLWRVTLGVAPGARLAILAGNRLEMLDAFFAAGKSGVIVVPLSTRATARELEQVLRDADVAGLLYDGAFAPTVRELAATLPDIRHWIALDDPVDPSHPRYEEALPPAPCDLSPAPGPEDVYCLLYTSGTTGKPKGVMIPHRMVAWNGVDTAISWQLRGEDVSPIFTPLYHAGGLGAFLVPIFTAGGRIVLHDRFDAAEVWRTIERERCTVVLGVPTIWKLLLEAPEAREVDLSHVRWFISGGAPLPVYLVHEYAELGVVLRQGYGLTEVGVNCFAMTDDDARRKAGSIGKPLMFTEARVVGPDNRPLPPDTVGELVFRGPHVSSGYWRDPEATAASRDEEGWLHTGDMARVDAEGYFTIAGRSKDMFISGGVNVYPAEIEGELLQHPAVQDAAVVGVPHERWGEAGVAFVVPRPGNAVTSEELTAFLLERLSKYKIPNAFRFVPELPRTPYGKVVKNALRALYAAESGR
jgi:fatty-acyl-CoA synthase